MEKRRKAMFFAVMLSETSHLFCCVLPSIFSVLSLMAGAGIIAVIPAPMTNMHDIMHDWEVPMIIASGLILGLGWIIDIHSRKVDCHDTGCHHEPCGKKKKRAHLVMSVATLLFAVNLMVYLVLHS